MKTLKKVVLLVVVALFLLPCYLKAQHLNEKEKNIVAISSLTAVGDIDHLKKALSKGLDAGLTINEIKEGLVQLYAYCGFPRSLNAINAFRSVLDERKAKGITDKTGREAAPAADTTDKYEQGRKTLELLTKTPQPRPAKGFGEFAPRIDAFLKEHLFADIFENDILNHRQRELVTISALAAMQGTEAQLRSHINVGKNTGIAEGELVVLADLIEQNISRARANEVRKLLLQPVKPLLEPDMMVRIAEIEIHSQYFKEYTDILKEEASASVTKEPGVIAIFPMYEKEKPTAIRLIEIYANKAAYEAHLKTPHFVHYKTATLKMIKSLKLIEMQSINEDEMGEIFSKVM